MVSARMQNSSAQSGIEQSVCRWPKTRAALRGAALGGQTVDSGTQLHNAVLGRAITADLAKSTSCWLPRCHQQEAKWSGTRAV